MKDGMESPDKKISGVSTGKQSGRTHTGSVHAGSGLRTGTKGGRGQSEAPPSASVSNESGGYVPPFGKR